MSRKILIMRLLRRDRAATGVCPGWNALAYCNLGASLGRRSIRRGRSMDRDAYGYGDGYSSAGHFPVDSLHPVSVLRQPLAYCFGDHHRTMLAASTPEGHGEIA